MHFTPHSNYNQSIWKLLPARDVAKLLIFTQLWIQEPYYQSCFIAIALFKYQNSASCFQKKGHVSSSQDCFSRRHCRPLTTRGPCSINWAAEGTEPTVGNNTDCWLLTCRIKVLNSSKEKQSAYKQFDNVVKHVSIDLPPCSCHPLLSLG